MAARIAFARSKSPAGLEPRIRKEAGTLVRAGHEVHAILWDREMAHPAEEVRDGLRIHRFRLRAPEGKPELTFLLPRWWSFLFFRILALRPDVVHAVDFDTMVAAYPAARIAGAGVVYDIFDFYAEMVTAPMSPRLRSLLAKAERQAIARADAVITPDVRRRVQFAPARPRRLVEIQNVPDDRGTMPRPADPDRFVVFYGGMLAKDRGLIDLVAACEATGAVLLVAGHGPDEASLLADLESSPAASYLGTVPYEEVLDRTAAASAVAALYDPRVPNNRFAAPNKIFEAMMLGKPVLVSAETLAADIVREVDCGIVVPYGDRKALQRALESLMLSPQTCAAMAARGRAAFESRYNWGAMEPRLLRLYGELLGEPGAARREGNRTSDSQSLFEPRR
jgi:glycosyltransferase involved in cell wall biosynthesis